MLISVDNTPSEELLKAVRAALLLKGLSFSAYCARRDLIRQNVAAALAGHWTGPKATRVVQEILHDLGLSE